MAWAALGKAALGAVKGKAKQIAADKLLNRKKNVKNRRAKAQEAMGGGEDQQDKGGALAIRPSTSLVPTGPTGLIKAPPTDSGGGGDDTSTPKAALMTIQTKIVKVEKLLAGSNAVKEKIREDQRQAAKDEEDKTQEKDLEKKVPKVKSKFKMPSVPGAGIFGTIWKFITTVVMGRLFMIFFEHLPKLMPFIKGAALVVDGLLIAAGWLLNVGVTIIDWGYKLVDGASNWVGDTFGEGAQKAFNGLLDVLKNFINAFLVWKIIGEKLVKALIKSITRAFRIGRIIVKKAVRFAKKALKFAKNAVSNALKVAKNLASRVGKNLMKIPGVKNVVQGAAKWGGKALQAGKGVLSKAGGLLKTGGKAAAGKVGGFAAKIFGKAANFIAPAMKSAKPFVSKFFGRIPIVGPLVVGIVSIISGDPPGQALFKTIGAALGGALGTFIPIPVLGTIIGETIGVFVGDMLYTLMFGGGLKAVGEKLKKQLLGVLNAGKAVFDFFKDGFGRFISTFPMVKFPETGIGTMLAKVLSINPIYKALLGWKVPGWPVIPKAIRGFSLGKLLESLPNIPEMLGFIFNMHPLLKGLVKDGKVEGFPAVWQLMNPVFMIKHFKESFFPSKGGASGASTDEASGGGEKPPAEVGAEEKDKDAGKKKDQSISGGASTQEEDLISANQKNGAQGVIEKINSYAPYEEQGGPTIIKVPNPQTTPQTMGEAKAAGEPIIVPMVVSSGGGDPYEDLDFFG